MGGAMKGEPYTYFITWTTYGAWLPGDSRGWTQHSHGEQTPQPMLEGWNHDRMVAKPLVLSPVQRRKVERACRMHADFRDWVIHALSARTNHVHIAITADVAPFKVRDQLKANSTRVLRTEPDPVNDTRVWTRGGDCKPITNDEGIENVVTYINEAQDRMSRGK